MVAVTAVAGAQPKEKPKQDEPGKLELSGAGKRLEDFENKVKRMRGQPFALGYPEKEALQRIEALRQKYPDNPEVAKLAERARLAIIASKGQTKEVAPDATGYRTLEKKLVGLFETEANREWEALMAKVKASKDPILAAFPPPSQEEVGIDELAGRYVVLEDFEYPRNEFTEMGRQYVFVGGGTTGYYFVDLSNRAWLGAYEAVKRYRRFVNQDVPEGMKWTLVGRISGVQLLVPEAGDKKSMAVRWGWTVEPVAIRVPGRTFALADAALPLGGAFAGEPRMEEIKSSFYTVKEVPADAAPEKVVEIFITAIKEKNYKLYLDCIEPSRRGTPKAQDLCLYHWEWHQHRFATFYCDVKVGKAATRVLKGFDEGDNIESKFLTEEDKAKIKKVSEPLVEEAELRTEAFDERGRQYGSPKPRFLKRVEKKRWYITNYPQPF
jgi:hypothetical protein